MSGSHNLFRSLNCLEGTILYIILVSPHSFLRQNYNFCSTAAISASSPSILFKIACSCSCEPISRSNRKGMLCYNHLLKKSLMALLYVHMVENSGSSSCFSSVRIFIVVILYCLKASVSQIAHNVNT